MYPWLPIGPLFAHEIDAASPLRKSALPVAIIAAERDEIVPQSARQRFARSFPTWSTTEPLPAPVTMTFIRGRISTKARATPCLPFWARPILGHGKVTAVDVTTCGSLAANPYS